MRAGSYNIYKGIYISESQSNQWDPSKVRFYLDHPFFFYKLLKQCMDHPEFNVILTEEEKEIFYYFRRSFDNDENREKETD